MYLPLPHNNQVLKRFSCEWFQIILTRMRTWRSWFFGKTWKLPPPVFFGLRLLFKDFWDPFLCKKPFQKLLSKFLHPFYKSVCSSLNTVNDYIDKNSNVSIDSFLNNLWPSSPPSSPDDKASLSYDFSYKILDFYNSFLLHVYMFHTNQILLHCHLLFQYYLPNLSHDNSTKPFF